LNRGVTQSDLVVVGHSHGEGVDAFAGRREG
jgi:hypothetical protein